MSLEHFLGLSYEIKIIDFLMSNLDITGKDNSGYSIEELSDFIDIDEPTIRYFLPRLQYNGIIDVDKDNIKLVENEITMSLLRAVFANSCLCSKYPDGIDENNFKSGGNNSPIIFR